MSTKSNTEKYRRRRKKEKANRRDNERDPRHPLYHRRMERARDRLAAAPRSMLEHIRRIAPPGSDLRQFAEDVYKDK